MENAKFGKMCLSKYVWIHRVLITSKLFLDKFGMHSNHSNEICFTKI